MAIGFNDGVAQRIPDRSFARRTQPKTLISSFGDGYEQRLPLGINNLQEEYTVSFTTRAKADIDDIATFLDGTNGANSFNFTVPDTNAGGELTIKVVCTGYNKIFNYGDFYSIDCVFRRVYEP